MQSSNPPEELVIRFTNVDYSHPNGIVALRGINLDVRKGELVAILGANGAGKSTLVRHMNGLLKPAHGSVTIFGEDSKTMSAAILSRKVGIVFQNPNNQLFAESVRSEIEFGLKNFGFTGQLLEQRTHWALETFTLLDYADRPPMELSGGEKKRLCSALVLAWSPDIFILDEPTVGQDSIQKEKLRETISSLRMEGKTVILVTHDVEFVWPLQSRVILMSDGRIVADGNSQNILGNESMTATSHVLSPELVELFRLLGARPPFPQNELVASEAISKMINKMES